jgi:hypothetical protein
MDKEKRMRVMKAIHKELTEQSTREKIATDYIHGLFKRVETAHFGPKNQEHD